MLINVKFIGGIMGYMYIRYYIKVDSWWWWWCVHFSSNVLFDSPSTLSPCVLSTT